MFSRFGRIFALSFLLASACGRGELAQSAATPDSASFTAHSQAIASTGGVIDSALPRAVELERFRNDLGPEPTELSGNFQSREALVAEFVKRLAAKEVVELSALGLTKAEFAWLYYPSSPLGKPPYDLSPGLMYFQFDGNSRKGLTHLLEERGGQPLNVAGFSCAVNEKQGENTIFSQCLFKRLQAPGDTLSELLFGGIIERRGHFKIINFANKF